MSVVLSVVNDASRREGLDRESQRPPVARLDVELSRRRIADLAHVPPQSTSAHPVHQLQLIHDATENNR